jgi:hypothetical protein
VSTFSREDLVVFYLTTWHYIPKKSTLQNLLDLYITVLLEFLERFKEKEQLKTCTFSMPGCIYCKYNIVQQYMCQKHKLTHFTVQFVSIFNLNKTESIML